MYQLILQLKSGGNCMLGVNFKNTDISLTNELCIDFFDTLVATL